MHIFPKNLLKVVSVQHVNAFTQLCLTPHWGETFTGIVVWCISWLSVPIEAVLPPDNDQSILIETSSCNLQFFFRTNYYSIERITYGVNASFLYLPMLYLPSNVYLDSKRVSILIESVLPTWPMLYLHFNVYLDSKRVSILIEAVLPTLPMLYLPINVYLDSKRVSILMEAVLPTWPMLYLHFNVYLDSQRGKHNS